MGGENLWPWPIDSNPLQHRSAIPRIAGANPPFLGSALGEPARGAKASGEDKPASRFGNRSAQFARCLDPLSNDNLDVRQGLLRLALTGLRDTVGGTKGSAA